MLTTAQLFGIALAPIYAAIADVESDNGLTSRNVYQITRQYVSDANRLSGGRFDWRQEAWVYPFCQNDRFDREKSERMMVSIWSHYGERLKKRYGGVNKWALCCIHRYGYHATCYLIEHGVPLKETVYCKKIQRAFDAQKWRRK